MHSIVVDTGTRLGHQVFDLLPAGAQVMTMTSRTLETIGVTDVIDEPTEMAESSRNDAVRPRLMLMDSASGSQLAPHAYRGWCCDIGQRPQHPRRRLVPMRKEPLPAHQH